MNMKKYQGIKLQKFNDSNEHGSLAIHFGVSAVSISDTGTLAGTLRDAISPYSWPRSVNWCLTEGSEISAAL